MPSSTGSGAPASRKVSLLTATNIVVASMVGVGVFTSLGFQVASMQSGFVLLLLWLVGGVLAMCGALSYAELAAALPRSGGEYNLLSRIYHPGLGFVAGWISITIGFAAPMAFASWAFAGYFHQFLPAMEPAAQLWVDKGIACTLLLLVMGAQFFNLQFSARFQNAMTALKIGLIVAIIFAVIIWGERQPINFLPAAGDMASIFSGEFAVGLFWVMLAYSGWNSSIYMYDDVAKPERNVPRSLAIGTTIVILLYVLLNAAFLYSTPIADMKLKKEVASVVAMHLWPSWGGLLMAVAICVGLIPTLSSYLWTGPRVARVMGQDHPLLAFLTRGAADGIPRAGILWQTTLAILYVVTLSFEQVMVYTEFSLSLCCFCTVFGVIWLRIRQPELARPYRTWGYPVTPAIFLVVSAYCLWRVFNNHPWESILGLSVIALGLAIFFADRQLARGRALTVPETGAVSTTPAP